MILNIIFVTFTVRVKCIIYANVLEINSISPFIHTPHEQKYSNGSKLL